MDAARPLFSANALAGCGLRPGGVATRLALAGCSAFPLLSGLAPAGAGVAGAPRELAGWPAFPGDSVESPESWLTGVGPDCLAGAGTAEATAGDQSAGWRIAMEVSAAMP